MVSGGLLPVWSTTAFWILMKPSHLRNMLSKLMRCTKNCNTCSPHRSTERAQFFSTTMPDQHVTQPTSQKLNKLGYKVLPHPPYSPDLSSPNYHFKHLDNFLQRKHFHNQQEAKKCFPRVLWTTKHRFLCYRNKQTYFSLAKNVLIVMAPTLTKKYVFEPSYNDLKFMVWNCNYFCTNLICTKK